MRLLPFTTVALLLGFAAPVLPGQEVVGRNQDTWTFSERVGRGDWFHFATQMGDVTVTEGGGDRVEIRAEKRLNRGRTDDIGFVVLRHRDGITVCAVYEEDDCSEDGIHRESRSNWRGSSRSRAGLEVTIRLPRGVKIHAGSGNGGVSVTGATDEVVASSGNGRVSVSGSGGEVRASSGNGAVTVDGARGPVSASSGNGEVNVTTTLGPVSASSGNGNLNVTMDALGERERMEFSTGNGRIRLTVPSNFAAEIDANTGNGTIDSEFPITLTGRLSKTRVRGTINGGGPRVRLTSGNGQIELRRGSDRGRNGER
jgi:putative adhesin